MAAQPKGQVIHVSMKNKQVKHTCTSCGNVHYSRILGKRETVRKPNRLELAGARMQAAGGRMTIGGSRKQAGAEMMLANLERQQREAINQRTYQGCPACGSQSHTSEIVKI